VFVLLLSGVLNLVLLNQLTHKVFLLHFLVFNSLTVGQSCFDIDSLLFLLINMGHKILKLMHLIVSHGGKMSQSGHPVTVVVRFSVRIGKVEM
jgi:hypothetical protein